LAASLTRAEQINRQNLIRPFGTEWQNEVLAFGCGLTPRINP
jgi:hypothetical protein